MKSVYLIVLAFGSSAFGQTITFKGCYNLFEDQVYTFNKTSVDGNNKNIYITTPVTGDQNCGGLGTCELKIQWNNSLSRWEILADEGNGTFTNPYLIYHNSTGNNNASNPPANNFGTWVENTAVTNGACGGNLTSSNSTMTGDVHTSFLNVLNGKSSKIQVFPNPVSDFISISGIEFPETIEIYNTAGQVVKSQEFKERANVSSLSTGTYILRVKTKDSVIHEFKFIKK